MSALSQLEAWFQTALYDPPSLEEVLNPSLLTAARHNPFFMLGSLLLALPGVVVALVGLVAGRRSQRHVAVVTGLAAIALGLLAAGVGLFGTLSGRASTRLAIALPDLTEQDRQRLTHAGNVEAAHHGTFGAAAGALPLLLGALGLVRAARARPKAG